MPAGRPLEPREAAVVEVYHSPAASEDGGVFPWIPVLGAGAALAVVVAGAAQLRRRPAAA